MMKTLLCFMYSIWFQLSSPIFKVRLSLEKKASYTLQFWMRGNRAFAHASVTEGKWRKLCIYYISNMFVAVWETYFLLELSHFWHKFKCNIVKYRLYTGCCNIMYMQTVFRLLCFQQMLNRRVMLYVDFDLPSKLFWCMYLYGCFAHWISLCVLK